MASMKSKYTTTSSSNATGTTTTTTTATASVVTAAAAETEGGLPLVEGGGDIMLSDSACPFNCVLCDGR
jgi:hypothetical protein